MNKLISFIVPVYNVEKYLEKCVDSIYKNCDKNVSEIILVDDGSKDKSLEIANKIKEKINIVKVYHKENGGLSDARNYGIKKATGKYLSFIDSDDYVDEGLKSLYKYLNDDYDIVFCGYKAIYLKETKLINYKKQGEYRKDIIKEALEISSKKNSACCKVIKRDFLINNDLFFNKGFAEDFNWIGRAIQYVTSCCITNLSFYNYVIQREGSLMNTYKKQKFIDVIEHANNIMDTLNQNKLSKKDENVVKKFIGFNIISNFRFVKNIDNDKDKDELYNLLTKNYSLIKKQEKICLKIFVVIGRIIGFKNIYRFF